MKLREKKKISFKEQLDHTESSGSEDEYKEESGEEEESDSMSEIEEEEEESEEEVEMEVEEKKPKPKKKPTQKRKSPIIKKENKGPAKPKSNILMESDSEDNDDVDKSEKEILELQKVHFINNGTELINNNEFFRRRKMQLQSSYECTEFEFDNESVHSDTSMTDLNDSTETNSNAKNHSNPPTVNYEEVARDLSEIIIKTLELGFMIPVTKSIQKSYTTYLQNEIKNNPDMKNESYSKVILNSLTVNDDVVTPNPRQTQLDTVNSLKDNSSQITTTTPGDIKNETETPPVSQIPPKRKRGRPPKNKNTKSTSSSSAKNSSTDSSSVDKKGTSSKITSYFNQIPSEASSPTTVPSTPTTTAPSSPTTPTTVPNVSTSRKRRKLKSNSVPDTQTISIQNYLTENTKDTTLKDVKIEMNSEQTSTTPLNNTNIIKLFKCSVSGSNYKCFFPSCNEVFNTNEDLVQHITSCYHDISPFIERRFIEKYFCKFYEF